MDSLRCFSIRQAVFYSVLAHGIAFSVLSPIVTESKKSDLGNAVKMEARLLQSAAVALPEISSVPEAPPARAIRQEEKAVPKTPRTVQPVVEAPKVVPPAETSQTETSLIEAAESATFFSSRSLEAGSVSQEGFAEHAGTGNTGTETGNSELEEYKWALTRAMKGERGYPRMARSRGITGKVITRLVWLPGFAAPRVELATSSGSNLLDEDALAKFTRAVRTTPLPEVLRARSFEFSQTVDYSLQNE
ncbi:MAG: TonB family protein [Betaproteobacteria bacterium]|nr:TonB family protein [Betaproteobacteria bacterium]